MQTSSTSLNWSKKEAPATNKQFYVMPAEVQNSSEVHISTCVLASTEVILIPPHHKAARR
jgi:hypothetical protein